MRRFEWILRFAGLLVLTSLTALHAAEPASDRPRFIAPPGFVVEKVAGPPLVKYPMLAGLDDQGRLYVAEGTGTNLPGVELEKLKLGRITRLEDNDGDGVYDRSTVFADRLIFPTGAMPRGGSVFGASHPSLWRFDDTDGDGKADRREEVVTRFNFNGNGCDVHGPFAGLDGYLYFTEGRHGYKIKTKEGPTLEGLASRIWRCRPDGSGIERICGGGFDNPVELAFSEEADLIGTMDQGPGDALLHYVEGGVYPMDHPCVKEFPMTGPMLGAVSQFSASLPVALCGLTRYRSAQFGPEYENTLFTAQFNVHRIQQHILVREGSTFRSINKDFLVSTDYDVHPTDVLEDADGSLLVVDMGAWFNFGCPTSKIAKPERLGAIYRVRRADAPRVADPRGAALKLAERSPEELAKWLDDPRPGVRDQAVDQLAARGSKAVEVLTGVAGSEAKPPRTPLARRNALWALSRIDDSEARRAVRAALNDADPSVKHVAVYALGLARDPEAIAALQRLVVSDDPPIRLKAAEALGRIRKADAIPALLASVRQGGFDRFLEHALIYALIQINAPTATRPALADASPRVRRVALIALDQMSDRRLTRDQIVPLLDTDDPELQQAALAVLSRDEGASGAILGRLRGWLRADRLTPDQERSLTGALLAFGTQENVQKIVTESLASQETKPDRRLLLLGVIARSRLDRLPPAWLDAIAGALDHADLRVRGEAIAAIRARALGEFDDRLTKLGQDASAPADLRIAALDALAARHRPLAPPAFALLVDHLRSDGEPLLQVAAARALGASALTDEQRLKLTGAIAEVGPMLVPLLLPAFQGSSSATLGAAVVAALKASPGAGAVSADELNKLLASYPAEVRAAAQPLLDRVAERQLKQEAYLGQLTTKLVTVEGNADRGRQVFYSKKVGCHGCHRIEGQGGAVGPDLSQIGRVRATRDLLEAIVYPSSTVVPAFRSYLIATRDGRLTHGMIVRETPEAVYVRTAELAEVRIPAKEVESMKESDASIMPQGLEKAMTAQEFSDLLEFLYQRR